MATIQIYRVAWLAFSGAASTALLGTSTHLRRAQISLISPTSSVTKSKSNSAGAWRSLVARTLGVREVTGSNPVAPTISSNQTDASRPSPVQLQPGQGKDGSGAGHRSGY